ncbi:hypothetical protein FKM82_000151 [Ascaphus truei]
MGVSPMEKDPQDTENTPQALIMKITQPQKRQRVKEREEVFVIARRPRIIRAPQPGISWDALPDELLLGIFSYLHLTNLLRVSRVCKRWHRLSFDESLWHSLDLTGKHLAKGVIGKVLSLGVVAFRCPRSCIGEPAFKKSRPLRLQHVDLSNGTISVTALRSILSRCHKLQNLSLEGLLLSDDIIRLKELNLSWCDFTADHVKVTVGHLPSHITQLNLSGYRQNLEISDVKSLVARCLDLTNLDLSDSVMLTTDCFPVFQQLAHLQHLALSRCYQICPATLLELGKIPSLKMLSVFGIVTDSSFQLLKESLPNIKINYSHFSTISRPTIGSKKCRDIWGIKCKLTLNHTDGL